MKVRILSFFRSQHETQIDKEKNMKTGEMNVRPEEILILDGYKIVLRYAERSIPKVLENIQDTLFNQNITPTKGPIFCNQADSMR